MSYGDCPTTPDAFALSNSRPIRVEPAPPNWFLLLAAQAELDRLFDAGVDEIGDALRASTHLALVMLAEGAPPEVRQRQIDRLQADIDAAKVQS
jgi:hypothetical protein